MSDKRTTFEVRGGKTGADHPEYPENIRYWDTLSTIAAEVKKQNNDPRSLKAIMVEIAKDNNLPGPRPGVDCNEKNISVVVIQPGQKLVLRTAEPINPELIYDCPPEKKKPIEAAPPIPSTPIEASTTIDLPAPEKTPYLYIPSVTAKEDYGNMISAAGFFQPWPPQRSRAVGTEDAARLRDGALLPAYSQGAKVKVNGKEIEAGAPGAKGKTYGGRSFHVELTDRDAAEHYIDANGNWTGYNPRFDRKAEYGPVKVVDGDGNVFNTSVGTAMNSAPAFDNAASRHQTTDHDTAHLRRNKHNYSAEDIGVMSYYSNAQIKYEQLATQLASTDSPEAAAVIADKMLATNAKLALSPLSWSVDSRGVPVKSFETIGSEMDAVLASPVLTEAARAELSAKFAPTREALGNPDQQWAALQAIGGLQGTYNPLVEMAREQVARTDEMNGRPVGKYLREGYWDAMGRQEGRNYSKEEKIELTAQAGEAYARKLESVGVRVPDQVIERVALVEQDVFNVGRQRATSMETARSEGLATIRNNPALMDDYIRYSLENPGVLQAISNRVYLSTMASQKGNRATLDFTKDSDADRYANQFVDLVAGKEFKGNLNYNGGIPVLKDIVNQVSFGAWQPWAAVNQDKGGFKFQQAALERFTNGTEEERNEIRAAYAELFDRSQSAAAKGVHDANADLVAVLDLRNAAHLNNGQAPENHKRLQAATGTLIRDNLVQRMNGLDQAGASAELRLEQLRARGVEFKTTIDTSAVAAAAASGDVKALGEAFRTNNNTTLFSQGDTDRNLSLVTQAATPLGFSMVALQAAQDPATAKRYDAYLQSIDNGDRNMSAYADRMKRHVKAYRAAAGDPAALQAAQAAAEADLTAYFDQADPNTNKGSVRLPISTASRYLAEHLAKDSPAAASFSAAMQAQLNGAASAMSAKEQMLLNAKLATTNSPEEQGRIIAEYTNSTTASVPAAVGSVDPNAALNASVPAAAPVLSADTQTKLAAIAADINLSAADRELQVAAALGEGNANVSQAQQAELSAIINAGGSDVAAKLAAYGTSTATNAGTPVLTADTQAQLAAIAASNVPASDKAQAINAALVAQVKAGGPALNADQTTALIAAVNAGGDNLPSVLAGFGTNVSTNASTNAGTPLLTAETQANIAALAADTNITAAEKAALISAELDAQVKAGGPALNADETTALIAAVNAGGDNLPSVLAGFGTNVSTNASTNAGTNVSTNASTNAGTNVSTNAGTGTPINAGTNTPINAGLVDALKSFNAGTSAETNAGIPSMIAGLPNVATNAHGGISWVVTVQNILTVLPFIDPNNPITKLDDIPGCTNVDRPCGIPGFPGVPTVPGRPGTTPGVGG